MNNSTITRHSGSSQRVTNELKKFTQVTDPKQVEKIKLYIGPSKLVESFKTFFIPPEHDCPEEVWASQSNPHFVWSDVFQIKVLDRNDWQVFDCPVCGHETMLRTQYTTAVDAKPIPPTGECDYCETKFPNPMVRKPQLGRRNAIYQATTTIT
jgi:hypothetical protein